MKDIGIKASSWSCMKVEVEGKRADQKIMLLYGIMILLVLVFQELLGKVGRIVANSLPYERFDPYKAFAWVSVHHIIIICKGRVSVKTGPKGSDKTQGGRPLVSHHHE